MNDELDTSPILEAFDGQLCVRNWPAGQAIPFGLRARGDVLIGPARMRSRVWQLLQGMEIPFLDLTVTRFCERDERWLAAPARIDPLLPAHGLADNRGIVQGIDEERRFCLTADLVQGWERAALVLTPDSAAAQRWQSRADAAGLGHAVYVVPIGARDVRAAVANFELLVVDWADLMPRGSLLSVLDAAPALGRIGFVDHLDTQLAEQLAPGLGAVVHCCDREASQSCHEIRVAMPSAQRAEYDTAWSTFFGAFDRFAATRPEVGFHAFVEHARKDPQSRPALLAWHRANRLASWHENKLEMIGALACRHEKVRTLVYTPTRAAAYEVGEAFLLPVVTSEIPALERRMLLDAFLAGELPMLVGPRLLDLAVPEGSVDVVVLAGGGFGAWQRDARVRRVRAGGEVVELTSLDTVEVGRAHRWRARAQPATTTVVDR